MAETSLIGKQLDEYRIDKPLGAGSMAQVYRALDTRLRRYVALKIITPEGQDNADYTTRFEREAQAIARLEHPNIVRIYRFGESIGLYYIAMQYIEGVDVGTLVSDYREDNEILPVDDTVRVIQDIGAALDYTHNHGVIHRDVKASNIIVTNQGQAVLTDFGLALAADAQTLGGLTGTPYYIAPEQVTGGAVPQSDLYSLGVTLFEMLTGELPFPGKNPVEVMMRHLSEPPRKPSAVLSSIPPSLDEIVLRCLAKNPADRFQTGAALSGALQQAVSQWKTDSGPRRPSMIMLAEKVSLARKEPSEPLPKPPSAPARPSAPSAVLEQVQIVDEPLNWVNIGIFAAIVFILGLVLFFTVIAR